mmetsp:Transcript_8051/g.11057  ORF Transcript_8051/g.11057 Transcript_8051/m.11057 type:complete len:127 (+) Transcript_8051:267-647(+)
MVYIIEPRCCNRRPDKYVPMVKTVEIPRRFSDGSVERIMVAETPKGDITINEYISISDITKTVVFLLKNDPNYYGFVTNTVFEAQDGTTILDYTVNWTPYKKETEGPDMANSIRNAVLHAKCIAEA